LTQPAEKLGALANVHASGNEITFGGSPDQQLSVVQNTTANNKVAQPSAAIAKSITSQRAMVAGMGRAVITI
jgi:hypothetical protein